MSPKHSPVSPTARRPHIAVAIMAVVLTALALLLSRATTGAAHPARLPVAPLVSPPTDQLIVRFRAVSDPAAMTATAEAQLADRLSAAAGAALTFQRPMSGGAYVLKMAERTDEATATAISRRLADLAEVEYAEPDAIMQLVRGPALAEAPDNADFDPDDTRFDDQWHYRYEAGVEEGLNLLPAWDITTGLDTTVVAVIDTGIRPHADLSGRTVPGYDFINDLFVANDGNGRDNNPADPGDWSTSSQCSPGSPAESSSWHGTHVAGTIAANSNNGSDVTGINWAAKILPVRVLGRCGGYLSDIVDATRWAAGLAVTGVPANANPAAVVNLSLGGSGACGATYQNAFNELNAAGVVSVVAAGNGGTNASNSRPANCDNVITVAATSKTGDQTYYTNYGAVVEIAAPGGEQFFANDPDGVLSTLNAGATGPGADNLVYYQGTSMAAPHVAGLVSLLLGVQPDMTPAEVLDILQSTARDFPGSSSCTTANCGAGIADAFAALSALSPDLVAPTLLSPADGATVDTLTPLTEWEAVADAELYMLHVATDPDFNDLVAVLAPIFDTGARPALAEEGTYYWRVRAIAGSDHGPWSETWQFTVELPGCQTPDVPVLLTPADGSDITELQPTFTWEASANASEYEIAIGETSDLSDVLVTDNPATPEWVFDDPLEVNRTYYWRVRAHNRAGDCDVSSDWSAIWSVNVVEQTAGQSRAALPFVIYGLTGFVGPLEVEPNNTLGEANGPILLNRNYQGYPDDQSDYYHFTLTTQSQLTINLTDITGTDPQLQLYHDTSGNMVGYDQNAPYSISYDAPPGDYWVRVVVVGNNNSLSLYTLSVNNP